MATFTIDLTSNGATGGNDLPASGLDKRFLQQMTVDFTVTANQLANAGIMALMVVPAYVLVERVFMLVHTADADINNLDIGVFSTAGAATSVDGFVDNADPSTTGLKQDLAGNTYSMQDGTYGYMGTSDWVIGLTNNDAHTINEAIITFYAICLDLRNAETE